MDASSKYMCIVENGTMEIGRKTFPLFVTCKTCMTTDMLVSCKLYSLYHTVPRFKWIVHKTSNPVSAYREPATYICIGFVPYIEGMAIDIKFHNRRKEFLIRNHNEGDRVRETRPVYYKGRYQSTLKFKRLYIRDRGRHSCDGELTSAISNPFIIKSLTITRFRVAVTLQSKYFSNQYGYVF